MWDSNRLTPLKPSQLVVGYWFGALLREFYMAVVFAAIGLIMVLLGGLPMTFWLGTQILVLSTTLLLGLLGVLASISSQRPEGGLLLIVPLLVIIPFSLQEPRMMVTDFLLPLYGIGSLFLAQAPDGSWAGPTVFGLDVPPVPFTLGLQFVMAIFVWRAVTRKVALPFDPILLRWEALALFAVLMATQHGLIWGLWSGYFPASLHRGYDDGDMMPMVQIVAILLSVVLLAMLSPLPERVRLEALRTRLETCAGFFPQRPFSGLGINRHRERLVADPIHVLLCRFLGSQFHRHRQPAQFSANIHPASGVGRLRFRRRAAGFIGLGLFILCILPFILAGVFSEEAIGHCSLLSPGVLALGDPGRDDMTNLLAD